MKLVWGKIGNSVVFAVMPRAELTDEEKAAGNGGVLVDLSRSKNGKCIFALETLAIHDGHAPRWVASDGAALPASSDPTMMAQTYMDRIKADIEAQGVSVTEVEIKEIPLPSMEHDGPDGPLDDPEDGSLPEGGWKKYGVDPN